MARGSKDIKILYPIQSDFLDEMPRSCPQLFNYCCVSGFQVFFRISSGSAPFYEVLTSAWKSSHYEPLKINYIKDCNLYYSGRSYDKAFSAFSELSYELVSMFRNFETADKEFIRAL